MWQFLRSISDTLGVGFLAMQLIKLIGMVFSLVGPLKFISSMFAGIFPVIGSFFRISFGWTINGLDVMAMAIALSGTLIVWSSVARKEALGTRYFFRFFMIPYALIVIVLAIVVQVATPIVEINQFNGQCKTETVDASFYGSSCSEMRPQLAFWDETFGDDPLVETDPNAAAAAASEMVAAEMNDEADDFIGLSFILALLYLAVVLPFVSLLVFFFKRLSINRLLKRVTIAGGSAIGLALASAAYASAFGG